MATKKTTKKIKDKLAEQYEAKIEELNQELNYPKVVKGSHLTVTTYADGRTELEWDHDALQRDVEEAIASVGKVAKKPKTKVVT